MKGLVNNIAKPFEDSLLMREMVFGSRCSIAHPFDGIHQQDPSSEESRECLSERIGENKMLNQLSPRPYSHSIDYSNKVIAHAHNVP